MTWRLKALLLMPVLLLMPACQDRPDAAAQQQQHREEAFIQHMDGVAMVGGSADRHGVPDQGGTQRYEIQGVDKTEQGWFIHARFRFGGRMLVLPVPVEMAWADDTPVIVVDDFGLLGMGPYSARILVHGDQWAGIWTGPNCGGQVFGVLERLDPATHPPKAAN